MNQYAAKKELTSLRKIIMLVQAVLFLAIVVLIWIIYCKGRTSLTTAIFVTAIIALGMFNSCLFELKQLLGAKYFGIKIAFDILIMLIIAGVILTWWNFSLVSWIIAILLLAVTVLIDYACQKSR
ncbi:hypothetical protein FD39_GL000908 [Lactobacillus amylolyticus DSM 11664]|uniref:Uncharacterized protein n=2 Tax=Lactobacillus amylolyticus TaxID=83683 RepID=D4YS45_9LACO|nr:hypothetical protein HMPREF0493_0323 [Lactobacillus amylolyticus DSM 11664]KRL19391.1 hypothetical protein FD39_GL000908 [Lactobacillus amylolyticus DSM 11664]